MRLVFCSNFMNHHQLPFCLQMVRNENVEFTFVATEPIPEDRLRLGYANLNKSYPWIICTYDSAQALQQAFHIIREADAVIIGSAPAFLLKERCRANGLIFRYSERIFKDAGDSRFPKAFLRRVAYFKRGYHKKNVHLLCASAYTASDYARLGFFQGRAYKWGYFPEVKVHEDMPALMKAKQPNSILWVARMIPLKHPELPILAAKRLLKEGHHFTLRMIGIGPMEEEMKALIKENGLEKHVHLLGAMSPEEVRVHMEHSEVFLFTSNRAEGWGAVMNEAMNSGCAVLASHVIGSVPFLLKNGENGLIYRDGDFEDFYAQLRNLLQDHDRTARLGENAYETMLREWSAEVAAQRLLQLTNSLILENKGDVFEDGPCSRAQCVREDWYGR